MKVKNLVLGSAVAFVFYWSLWLLLATGVL